MNAAASKPPSPSLILVRHGQASLGTADYDRLSEVGQRQAGYLADCLGDCLGDGLAGAEVWHGSLKRQRQTAAAMAPGQPSRVDPALNEYTVDALMKSAIAQAGPLGLTVPQQQAFADPVAYLATFLEWFPDVLAVWQSAELDCVHNGRWQDFHSRVLSPLPAWRATLAAGRQVVAVSSAGVISTLAASLLGKELAWQRRLNVSLHNASITELSLQPDGRWRLERVNWVDHLPAAMRTLA